MSASTENKTTDERLIEAIKSVTSLVEGEYMKRASRRTSNHDMGCMVNDAPILITAHALLSWLDSDGLRIAKALEEIAESVDFIAARYDGDEARAVPTERESWLMYHALEGSHLKRAARSGQLKNTEETDAASLRLKKLARL